jgi:hypothetical protein
MLFEHQLNPSCRHYVLGVGLMDLLDQSLMDYLMVLQVVEVVLNLDLDL